MVSSAGDGSGSVYDTTNLSQLNEGKTKIIYKLSDTEVLVHSKDKLTAFNAQRAHDVEGKAKLSNSTNCLVFEYLSRAGISTHFISKVSETQFRALLCDMIPLEWIARRVATGSFLKRNPGVPEGMRFCPPKVEISFKDDEQGDPFWTEEMVIASKMVIGGVKIGEPEVRKMALMTRAIFEMLERAWSVQGCSLIDMKIEFGVHPSTGQILLSDVIDSDSWRLWPAGDRRLQLDKQFYRDLAAVSQEDLAQLKKNYEKAMEMLKNFTSPPRGRLVVLMGSPSDMEFCQKIQKTAQAKFGVPTQMHITSAHKGTDETLRIVAKYEGDPTPTVFICVAGRSNGLGPVLAGNTAHPVINCPPLAPETGHLDVWSSLRLPSGLACTTITSPEGAAQAGATIIAQHDHQVYAKLVGAKLQNAVALIDADVKLNAQVKTTEN